MEISYSEIALNYNLNLIDIRENYLYQRGTIKNAVNIPYNMLKMFPDRYIDKSSVYYLFCENGIVSLNLARFLTNKGYQVYSIKEGYRDIIS